MEEERRLTNNKGITMAQWKIVNRNDGFVNPPRLPFSCEISGALHLAESDLTTGALHLAESGLTTGWQAGWQADEYLVVYGIFESCVTRCLEQI